MKNLLYYPGFEVKNTTWLKFALLYIDDLCPIIPYGAEKTLNDTTKAIMKQTDLIAPYRPNYEEGSYASIKAVEQFERFLRHPELYIYHFKTLGKDNDLLKKWRNKEYQNYVVYQEKYTTEFSDFCLRERLAHSCSEGIRLPEDLAFTYMSLLAEYISYANQMETITDITKYNSFLLHTHRSVAHEANIELRTAQNQIELDLPKSLNRIPIDVIINLRCNPNFNKLRIAFSKTIKDMVDNQEPSSKVLSDYLSYKREFKTFLASTIEIAGAIILTSYSILALQSNQMNPFEIVATATSALMDFKAGADVYNSIPKAIKNSKQKHLTRKYLANIKQIKFIDSQPLRK